MLGEAKLFLSIVTAAHLLGNCIEPIRTDHFIRFKKLVQRQAKRHLGA